MRTDRALSALLMSAILGTAQAQIEQVATFPVTSFGLQARDLVVVGDVIYFRNWTAEHGLELWKTDGSPGGTVMVKDINPGAANGLEANDGMVAVNGVLYFAASNGSNGLELWRSDGSDAGTVMVMDINPGSLGSSPAYLTAFGNRLLFRANNATDEALYSSDGTAGGTFTPVDFVTQHTITVSGPIRPMGSVAVFPGTAQSAAGGELWTTDGTLSGCYLLADICPGPGWSGAAGRSWPAEDHLYFLADDCTNGLELWRTNGGASATTMVADVYPGNPDAQPYHFVHFDGQAIFAAFDGMGNGIYRTDGTAIGTYKIATMGLPQLWSGDRQPARALGSIALFMGSDADHGYELWRSDGTEAGTVMVKDIWPGANGSIAGAGTNFWVFGGHLYFAPDVPISGTELWRSDGTEAGTMMVQDRAPGLNSFAPDHLVEMGGYLYMTGSLTNFDRGIYRMALPTTGLVDAAVPVPLRVVPNPTSGLGCSLQIPEQLAHHAGLQADVLDATGRVVQQSSLPMGTSLPLTFHHPLPAGMYTVRVRDAQGELCSAQLVVQ